MTRLFTILFLIFVYACIALIEIHAQDATIPPDWEKVGVCQINFLIPKNLKNQYSRGIDSCFAEFRSKNMYLAIDSGSWGGGEQTKIESNLDFKEESVEIDGKKAQIITYKDAQKKSKRKFIAVFNVVLYESQKNEIQRNVNLSMKIEAKNENDLETAKQIFQSIRFDAYSPRFYTIEQ